MTKESIRKIRAINTEALIRCARCPQCGYRLDGLPQRGFCPECGFGYSPDLVVLYGSGVDKRTGWGKVLTYLYMIVIVVAMIFGSRFPYLNREWMLPVVLIGFSFVFESYRRFMRGEMPTETQLRFSSDGFVQRDGVGEATLTPWTRDHKIELAPRWLESGYLLKIRGSMSRFVLDHPVQFAFEADEVTAAEIRKRLRACQQFALAASR